MSDWTVDTLREHMIMLLEFRDVRYRERFDAQNQALQAALASAEKAVSKAELAAERRFESMNAFRGQLADQAATLMPRMEAEQRIASQAEKYDGLEARLNEAIRRIDVREGRVVGHVDSTKNLVMVVGLALTAITVLVGLWVAFHH